MGSCHMCPLTGRVRSSLKITAGVSHESAHLGELFVRGTIPLSGSRPLSGPLPRVESQHFSWAYSGARNGPHAQRADGRAYPRLERSAAGPGPSQERSTRPQTIGYSLVGLASWIYAMFQDVGGSHDQHGDAVVLCTFDEMIDDTMLYWLPNTAASGALEPESQRKRLGHHWRA
jgi:hypothetical protein